MFEANLTSILLPKNNVIFGVNRQLMKWPVNYYFFVEIFKSLPNFSPQAQLRNEVRKHWRSWCRQLKLVGMLL